MKVSEIIKNSSLSGEEREQFHVLLMRYSSVFSNQPGRTTEYYHTIKLSDPTEFFVKPYPIPISHRDAVQETINKMLAWNVIERASSKYVSPLMATPKKDGTVRVCLDARRLNKAMESDYELPKPIDEIIKMMSGKRVMSSLDLTHGYWQVPLREEDRQYTGFMVNTKTYVFNVLPFGLKNATSSFTRCMDVIFGPEFHDYVVTYVDDILIMSENVQQHLEHLSNVFHRLIQAGLTLKLEKCQFFRSRMPYLGYVLTADGVQPDPSRIQAITDYQRPNNRKELQKFLGLCQYDRAFSFHFADKAEPLTRLLRKNVSWKWEQPEQEAFEVVKADLQQQTLLCHPDPKLPWNVQSDASNLGIAGILFQISSDGQRRIVAYASRLLLDRERRYGSYEKELLASLWVIQKWRTYLLGSTFTLFTDCKALMYINTCRLLSPRITRWALALQEFSYEIAYVPGHQNIQADALSRHACVRLPSPADNCFQICSSRLKFSPDFLTILKRIKTYQSEDNKLQEIKNALPLDKNVEKHFLLHRGILYKRGSDENQFLLCVPENLVPQFVEAYHRTLGHYGVHKTWIFMRAEVWWTNMHRKIKRIVNSCDICQRAKISVMPAPAQGKILPSDKEDIVALDVYGPLIRSRGGTQYILVVVNLFTKYVVLYPLKRATARVMLNKMFKDYFPTYGKPRRILQDRGTQFTSNIWRESMEQAEVKLVYTSVRHPAANPAERIMRELGRLFRTYCSSHHSRWAWEVTNFTQFLNEIVHESTGYSPSELQLGTNRLKLLPRNLQVTPEDPPSLESKLILADATLSSKAARRAFRNPGRPSPEFQPGDLVLLKANNTSSAIKAETKKFLLLFEGPYKIKKKTHDNVYVLSTPGDDANERGTFHSSHLKKYNIPSAQVQ